MGVVTWSSIIFDMAESDQGLERSQSGNFGVSEILYKVLVVGNFGVGQ